MINWSRSTMRFPCTTLGFKSTLENPGAMMFREIASRCYSGWNEIGSHRQTVAQGNASAGKSVLSSGIANEEIRS